MVDGVVKPKLQRKRGKVDDGSRILVRRNRVVALHPDVLIKEPAGGQGEFSPAARSLRGPCTPHQDSAFVRALLQNPHAVAADNRGSLQILTVETGIRCTCIEASIPLREV